MKRKLKQYFSLTVGLILIITLLVFANGCSREAKIYENGFFQYIVLEKSGLYSDEEIGSIAIVGFTTSGLEQEIIDIPREIDGKPVRYIGYRNWSTFMNSFYHLESDNLKKVYIHENIKRVYDEAFVYFSENEHDLDIMVCEPKSPYLIFADHYFGEFYIYKSLFDSNDFNSNIYPANIVFMNNYSGEVNRGYYSLDNIDTGEKIPLPSNPERNGYEFIGWYTEPECINEWDFDVSPTIKEGAEFKLYAKWEKV